MKASVFVAIGILAALMIGCVPSQAASAGTVTVYSAAGSPDFAIEVENVGYFALDATYLNFSVMSHPTHDADLYIGTNATYYVHVSINDGVTNYTWNKTLAVKNDVHVYANISMADPATTAPFVANATATLTVLLLHHDGTEENYTTAEIAIFTNTLAGAVLNYVPMIIAIGILGIMLPMVAKFGKRK